MSPTIVRNADPYAPVGPVTCHWMRRDRGRLPTKIAIVMSPAMCRHFGISKPQLLEKARAARIVAWGIANPRCENCQGTIEAGKRCSDCGR